MDISPTPIGPGFKRTDLKAGMRISFPYQNQLYKGTIDGFNIIEGREILYVDGVAYRWDEFDLRPVYVVIEEKLEPKIEVKVKVEKPKKKVAGFKLVKKLTKKHK